MSISVMSEVWELDLDSNLKLTLLGFADHADDSGRCYPSIRRIAWKSGLSRRTVQRHVRELEDQGLIEVVEEGGGRGKPRTYQLHVEKGDKLTPFHKKGDTVTERASTTTEKGDTGDAQTISNRHKNRQGGSEDVKSSGRRPDVENSRNGDGWNARLAPLIRDVAYNGDGAPPGHSLTRCLSKAKELLSKGYTVEDLEDAIRGLRDMADRKHPQVRDWIAPEDRFTMLAFGRAEERGQKLVQLAAAHHRKHAEVEVDSI